MKYLYAIAAVLLIAYAAIQYHTLQELIHEQAEEEQSPFGRQEWRNKMRGGMPAPEAVLKARNEMRQREYLYCS